MLIISHGEKFEKKKKYTLKSQWFINLYFFKGNSIWKFVYGRIKIILNKNFSISISSYLFSIWQSLLIYTVIISVLLFFGWIDQDTNNWNQTQYIRNRGCFIKKYISNKKEQHWDKGFARIKILIEVIIKLIKVIMIWNSIIKMITWLI